jgi:hypothetical protein
VTYSIGTYLLERYKNDEDKWSILRTTVARESTGVKDNTLEVVVHGNLYPPGNGLWTWMSPMFSYTEISEEEVSIYKMSSN